MLVRMLQQLEPDPYKLRDMTPAQIARCHGPAVADYIVELRWFEDLWRKIANDRAKDDRTDKS